MYKDDNITGGCSDSLLRILSEGRSSSCPACERCPSHGNGGCPTEDHTSESWGIHAYPLASVYAPLQEFENIYDMGVALNQGTIFAQLDLPFKGDRRVSKGGNCRG